VGGELPSSPARPRQSETTCSVLTVAMDSCGFGSSVHGEGGGNGDPDWSRSESLRGSFNAGENWAPARHWWSRRQPSVSWSRAVGPLGHGKSADDEP